MRKDGTKLVKVNSESNKVTRVCKTAFDELQRCVSIIGYYGCEKTGYPYKDKIKEGSIAEYAIHKYLQELEEKTSQTQGGQK